MATILVVDDDHDIVRLVKAFLDMDGHTVVGVHGGQEALDFLAVHAVDLVLLDILMPLPDGNNVLERLPSLIPVVVVLTGDVSSVRDDLRHRAHCTLKKPFELAMLRLTVTKALDYVKTLECAAP